VRNYTTADGLAHERVRCITRDSRGSLWFCTGDGLSRFDGYGFTNYSVAEGLPQPFVYQIAEGRGGVYRVATASGVARFIPSGARAAGAPPPDPCKPPESFRATLSFYDAEGRATLFYPGAMIGG
jgi:hypothetical protein